MSSLVERNIIWFSFDEYVIFLDDVLSIRQCNRNINCEIHYDDYRRDVLICRGFKEP